MFPSDSVEHSLLLSSPLALFHLLMTQSVIRMTTLDRLLSK